MKEPHVQPGSGFMHVGKLVALSVEIRLGMQRVVLSAAELERQLALPGLADRLLSLLQQHDESGEREPTEGSKQVSLSPIANADQNIPTALALKGKEGCGEPWGNASPNAVDKFQENGEGFARYLAQTLGDTTLQNIRHYRRIVRLVPRHLILDALGRAKDAQDVRKTRAHLFTHLVKPHLPVRPARPEEPPRPL